VKIKDYNSDPKVIVSKRERMKRFHADPEFARVHKEKIKLNYANPEFAIAHRNAIRRCYLNPEFAKAQADRARKNMKKLYDNPEFAKANKERARINADNLRHKRWNFQGNFYDSQSEAATGVLMEKYIPEFKVIEHKTFQMNTEIPKTIDFLVNGTFVEWHPILAFCGTDNLGSIPTREEAESYKRVLSELEGEEKKRFEREYKQVLAMNYFNSRQEAINQSPTYQGSKLILAQTPQELYDSVITRFGANYPSRDDFVREFNQVVKEVKQSNKKTELKLNQKAA
jgi:hypothetical protein